MTATTDVAAGSGGTQSAAATETVVTRVRDRARSTPDLVALRVKDRGIWREVTWARYWDQVELVAHALLALGVRPGDRVAVHAENRPEWLYADLGAMAIRAATVGLYPTSPAAEAGYVLAHSGARVLVAEDQEQVDKALAVTADVPDLERIVHLESRGISGRYDDPRLTSWDELLALGARHRAEHPDVLEPLVAAARPNDLATLIYTSGTTGPPKGAMLSVVNVEFAASVLAGGVGFGGAAPSTQDFTLSYLPLCHVAERIFTTWLGAAAGVQVHFGESTDVQANLREVEPTILFGVPRVWERILAGVEIRVWSASWLKRRVGRLGLRLAERVGSRLVASGGRYDLVTRLYYAVGWLVLFRTLRERLGLRRVRYAASGAAPIAPEVLRFFMGIGVPMHEVYGMTENSGIATANRAGRIRLGSVGEPQPGVELRLDLDTGEILTRHLGIFLGYWNDPDATAEVTDTDGWLRTGDAGEWVEDTHLRITDRIKDILITAGGKNVAPSPIENALKASPYVREAMLVGDGRPYLTALIGIEYDTVGNWAQNRGLAHTTYRDLSEKAEVRDLVRTVVAGVNARLAPVEQVKDFRLLTKELDHEDGELTATQKVRRTALAAAFDDLVEQMYGRQR